jgi:heme exporter protein CcmD
MGKYGFYVWGAYGISAISLGALVFMSLRARHQNQQGLNRLQDNPDDASHL